MNTKHQPGFTVLEFLIVLAIILILIAILLPNLQTARNRSFDEKKITDLKSMVLGLEQFKQSCGTYPESMTALTECGPTDPQHTLKDYIPEIEQYQFNTGVDGDIMYIPLSSSSVDPICSSFHLAFKLTNGNQTTGIFANGDSNIDSGAGIGLGTYALCSGSTANPINGTDPTVFDIFK